MHAATTIPAIEPLAASGSEGLDLLDAAVHDAPQGVLVVAGRADSYRIAYANVAMQALTGFLLPERSDMRLADLPLFGGPFTELLQGADAAGGSVEKDLVLRDRHRELSLHVEVSERAGGLRLLRVAEPAPADERAPLATLERCALAGRQGHWEWDLVAGTAWYDGMAARLLGGTSRDLAPSPKALHTRVHDDDRALLLSAIRRHLEQQQPFDIDLRLKDAEPEVWLRLKGEASRDSAALPMRMCGTLEDVTDRHRQLTDARADQAMLRATLDALRKGIAVLDPTGCILEINRTWADWPSAAGLMGLRFGFSENYAELCRSAQDRCAAATAAADGVERVLSGAEAEFVLNYRSLDLDGVDRAMQMRVQAFDTDKGRGAIVTHIDATGVDQAVRALRDNDAFYRMVLNSVPLYISYVNDRSELAFVNRIGEEWLGQPLEVLRGRRLDELSDAESYKAIAPRVDAVLAGRRVDFETQLLRDGVASIAAVSYVPHVVGGEVIGFFSVARDVTQEKRLETELLQAQKMEAMGRLTGGVAHDFNNLLSVIIGNLQLLEREAGAGSPFRNRISTALGAANRGSDLTRRLLSFSRRRTVDPKPIDVNTVVAGLEDLLERTISSSIQFSIASQANVWPICVDAGELENALLNLAINAGDAMPNGGSLVLTTRNLAAPASSAGQATALPPGEYVEIAVTDTGCGMPPEVVSKAFEPFFTTKEPGKGTGLGLSIVYGLAVRAGGTAVIDTRPGAGTSVKLFFPRYVADASRSGGRTARGAAHTGRGRVLVIDASAVRAGETRRVLSEGGFDVAVLGRSADVLAAATSPEAPDLVLIGDLPGGDLAPVALADRLRLLNPSIRVLHAAGTGLRQGTTPSVLPANTPDLVGAVRFALAKESASHV